MPSLKNWDNQTWLSSKKYIESFNSFINGRLKQLPSEKPTIQDWEDHLSTIFTEVRLKKFIEVRGADAGNWRRTCALPAFWVGILYDHESLRRGSVSYTHLTLPTKRIV